MKKLLIATILSATAITANAEEMPADAKKIMPAFPPAISFEKAKEIALKAVKDSIKVGESELELEEGESFTYEITVEVGGVETEVEIDATTGEVLEMEADD